MFAAIQKWPSRLVRVNRDGCFARLDAVFEKRAALRLGGVAAQPVVRARQLPGDLEVLRIPSQLGDPHRLRLPRARKVGPVGIEGIGGGRGTLTARDAGAASAGSGAAEVSPRARVWPTECRYRIEKCRI